MALFSGKMTYPEALKVFFTESEGKTEQEIEQLRRDFNAVLPEITRREFEGGPCLTSYRI